MAFPSLYPERLVGKIGKLMISDVGEWYRPFVRIGLFWWCPPTPFKQRRNFV